MYAARYFPKRYFAGRYFPPVTGGGFAGWTEVASGGISFGGAAALNDIFAEAGSGGITLSGGVLQSDTYVEIPSGGITLSGAAIVQWIPAGAAGFARRLWYRLGLGF
jgi:hypothetical protein